MGVLLESQIKSIIANAFAGQLLTGTLRKVTYTGVDAYGDPTGGTPTSSTFDGIQEDYDAKYRVDCGIPATHCRVLIIAGSMTSVPEREDLINIRSQWFKIHAVETDPARATWDCECSRVEAP